MRLQFSLLCLRVVRVGLEVVDMHSARAEATNALSPLTIPKQTWPCS
jgi:hypothetical protein